MNRAYSMGDNKLNLDRPLLSVRRRVVTPTPACEETKTCNDTHRIPAHRSELKSGPVRNPGVVPFIWERAPGQPKEDVRNTESSKGETRSSESEESDEVYADARDTLSRTESLSLNCSMSVLSGEVGLPVVQAREFMMDRFLPAAKAMASETSTPQYLTGKQHVVVQEQSQRVKESANRYIKPSLRYGPSFAKKYAQYQENDEEEKSDDGYDRPQDLSSVCGLLPRFCVRGSVCVLNPVPAMSVRSRQSRKFQQKLVDKIQTAELADDKMKSRRNEGGRSESRHSTATHGDAILWCREVKEVYAIPEVRMHRGTKGFGPDGKGFNAFEETNSESPVVEKTLYVDTMQVVESLNLDTTDSSREDFKKLRTVNRGEGLLPNAHEPDEANEATGGLEKHQNYPRHPVPPPLPKSPSDSWLCRTLPYMATKRSSVRSYPQNQFPKAPTGDVKWETIVTTTNAQHRRVHYPEGSLTTISET